MAEIGYTSFRFPATFDPSPDTHAYNIQPVDSTGDVAPILASSLTSRIPSHLIVESSTQELDKIRQSTDYNNQNQTQMIGISCLELISKLQGVPNTPEFQAPELLLEGQLSLQGDIWSLDCILCQEPLSSDDLTNDFKIFGLVTREGLFDIIESSSEELIDAWVTFLGPLPRKWSHHHGHLGAYDCLRKRRSSLLCRCFIHDPLCKYETNIKGERIELTACRLARHAKLTCQALG